MKTKKCPECGAALLPGRNFCPNCGTGPQDGTVLKTAKTVSTQVALICPECGQRSQWWFGGDYVVGEDDWDLVEEEPVINCSECDAAFKLPANPFAARKSKVG